MSCTLTVNKVKFELWQGLTLECDPPILVFTVNSKTGIKWNPYVSPEKLQKVYEWSQHQAEPEILKASAGPDVECQIETRDQTISFFTKTLRLKLITGTCFNFKNSVSVDIGYYQLGDINGGVIFKYSDGMLYPISCSFTDTPESSDQESETKEDCETSSDQESKDSYQEIWDRMDDLNENIISADSVNVVMSLFQRYSRVYFKEHPDSDTSELIEQLVNNFKKR